MCTVLVLPEVPLCDSHCNRRDQPQPVYLQMTEETVEKIKKKLDLVFSKLPHQKQQKDEKKKSNCENQNQTDRV